MRFMAAMILAGAVVLGHATLVCAGTFPGVITRDSMTSAESLGRLSVGVDYSQIKREIASPAARADVLDAEMVDGFLAVDVVPWFSPFVTIGGSSVSESVGRDQGDFGTKWSIGISLNAWHYQLENPSYMEGTLSIRAIAEYSSYQSDNVTYEGDTMEWSEMSVMLPFCYEMFEDTSALDDPNLRKSLALYVGPVFSTIDGTVKGGWQSDFSEKNAVGIVGGADIFLAVNLSIGATVTYFDEVTFSGGLRYHFY